MKWCTDLTDFRCIFEDICEKRKKEGCAACEEYNDCLYCKDRGTCKEAVIAE